MKYSKQLGGELVRELIAFFVLTLSIVVLWRNNLLLFLVVLFEGMAALSLWHDRFDLCFFLVIAVLGSLAEVVFVRFDIWRYANPTFLGIPLWFPVAFATAALIGERLVRTVTGLWEEISLSRISKK